MTTIQLDRQIPIDRSIYPSFYLSVCLKCRHTIVTFSQSHCQFIQRILRRIPLPPHFSMLCQDGPMSLLTLLKDLNSCFLLEAQPSDRRCPVIEPTQCPYLLCIRINYILCSIIPARSLSRSVYVLTNNVLVYAQHKNRTTIVLNAQATKTDYQSIGGPLKIQQQQKYNSKIIQI